MSELGGLRPTVRHPSTNEKSPTQTNRQTISNQFTGTNIPIENYENRGKFGNSLPIFSQREEAGRKPIAGNLDSSFYDLCTYW